MDAAGNLFVEQDVVHGLCDIRVYADGKFTHISCAFVGVEDVFQTFFVVAVAVDDFPVFECEFYIFKCKAVVFGRGVVSDNAVDGVANGGCVDFPVGNVAGAGAFHSRNVLNGECQVGAFCHQTNFVCAVHQVNDAVHGFGHFAVVQIAYIEVEIFKVFQTGVCGLCHAVGGVAQYHPFCMGYADFMVNRRRVIFFVNALFFVGHVCLFGDVVFTTNADERVHFVHEQAVCLCHELHLFFCGTQQQFTFQRVCHQLQKGCCTDFVYFFDDGFYQRRRMDAVLVNHDFFAFLQAAGIMHQIISQLFNSRVHISISFRCNLLYSFLFYPFSVKYAKKITGKFDTPPKDGYNRTKKGRCGSCGLPFPQRTGRFFSGTAKRKWKSNW